MRFLKDIGAPLPGALKTAANFILNAELRRQFEGGQPDPARFGTLLQEAQTDNVDLQREELGYAIKAHFDSQLEQLTKAPDDLALLARTAEIAAIVHTVDIEVNLWKTQNLYYGLLRTLYPSQVERTDEDARSWVKLFRGGWAISCASPLLSRHLPCRQANRSPPRKSQP